MAYVSSDIKTLAINHIKTKDSLAPPGDATGSAGGTDCHKRVNKRGPGSSLVVQLIRERQR